jgi:predicted dithiol-disulfide oxidoreductase (DUF899 family)
METDTSCYKSSQLFYAANRTNAPVCLNASSARFRVSLLPVRERAFSARCCCALQHECRERLNSARAGPGAQTSREASTLGRARNSECYFNEQRDDDDSERYFEESTQRGAFGTDDAPSQTARVSGRVLRRLSIGLPLEQWRRLAAEENQPMGITFPGESVEYRTARASLLEQEIALRRNMESVAAARRELPQGGPVPEDYVFQCMRPDGSAGDVKLSELFAPSSSALVIYSFMFPRHPSDPRPGPETGATARLDLVDGPCPSCTALLDQLDGAAEHVSQHADLVIVAKAPLSQLLTFAEERRWRQLRILSCGANHYNRDYFGETAQGDSSPMLNVFQRADGLIRHFWGSELLYAPTEPGQDPRHVGTIEPLWNLFDLTPAGRGADWEEQLNYCCAAKSARS